MVRSVTISLLVGANSICLTRRPSDQMSSDLQSLYLVSTSSSPHLKTTRDFLVNSNGKYSFITGADSMGVSKCFNLLVKQHPTTVSVKGITGYTLPVLGSYELSPTDSQFTAITSAFLAIESGFSVIGLNAINPESFSFFSFSSPRYQLLGLILGCSNVSGGIKMIPLSLEASDSPVFMEVHIIPLGLLQPMQKVFRDFVSKGLINPVNSYTWTTSTVTGTKRKRNTPKNRGDFSITVTEISKVVIVHQFIARGDY